MKTTLVCGCLALSFWTFIAGGATPQANAGPGDKSLAEYLRVETMQLAGGCLAEAKTVAEWKRQHEETRQELLEMLGLSPLPERTDLQPVVTGKVEHELFTVEKLHFQSRPGLYVTANLYLPRNIQKPLP